MKKILEWLVWLALISFVSYCAFALITQKTARAHDHNFPEWDAWFARQKMPDNPSIPCCGKHEVYWADAFEVTKDGRYVAIITDDRPDKDFAGPGKHRKHIPVGTKIIVPKWKINSALVDGNPTGHGVIFVSPLAIDAYLSGTMPDENGFIGPMPLVYCYFPPGGI